MSENDIGSLLIRIEADMKDFQSKMDKAVDIMEKAKKQTGSLSSSIKNAFAFAGGFAIFNTIKAGFENSVKAGWEFNKTMEQNQIALESMLGSTEKATAMLGKLSKMAAETPFEFPELATAAKKMMAFGFEAQKIPMIMTSIGDASAGLGLGADGINRITIALGQMMAKGRVQAGEILQLTEAGIPAQEILAKGFGKTTAEIVKMQEQGLLPARKAIDLLIAGMEEKFPNMMAKQSKSFNGLMSTIRDNVQITFGKILEPAFENMTANVLPAVIDKLGDFAEKVGTQGLAAAVEDLVLGFDKLLPLMSGTAATLVTFKVITTIDAAMKAWKASTIAMTYAQGGLNAVLAANPIGAVAVAIGLLIAGITLLVARQRKAINEMKQQLIEGYKAERDAALESIEKQHEERLSSLNTQLDAEADAHDERLANIQTEYDKEVKSIGKKEAALKKSLNERQSLLEDDHKKAIERIQDEYGVFEEKAKSKTEIIQEEVNKQKNVIDEVLELSEDAAEAEGEAFRKTYDAILDKAREAHNEKIEMYEQEYLASIGLINSDLAATIKALKKEIDAIEGKTEEEERLLKQQENEEKLARLRKKVADAETDAERLEATKDLNEEINRQSREKELENRRIQIDSLNEQIKTAQAKATEEKNNALKTLREKLASEKIEIDKDASYKIGLIQKERIAKEEAENKKYNAAKTALDKEETALDGYGERYKEKLEAELAEKKRIEDEKFKAVQDRLKKELETEEKAMEDAKKAAEEAYQESVELAEERAKEAVKKEYISPLLPDKATLRTYRPMPFGPTIGEMFPGFASGVKDFSGGLALVGEKGPELVNLPRGSDVHSNSETQRMLGNPMNFEGMFKGANFYVRSDNDARLLAREFYNFTQGKNRGSGIVPAT